MTCKVPTRREQLAKRHKRVRNTVEGTPERPRLAVFRSNNHMYAQVIDDVSQSTLVMTSTLSKDIKSGLNGVTNNTEAAAAVGKAVAELCKEKPAGLEAVRFLGQWLLDNNPNQPAVQEPE